MERALKQAREIVEEYNAVSVGAGDDAPADKSQATLDDLDTMLEKINHGDGDSPYVEVTYAVSKVYLPTDGGVPRSETAAGSTRMHLRDVPGWLLDRNVQMQFPMITGIRPI